MPRDALPRQRRLPLGFVAAKLLRALGTIWLVVTFVFVTLRLSGDPVGVYMPDDAPQEMIEQYRRLWGLDRSLPEQYLAYLGAVLRADLGVSFHDGRSAVGLVLEHLPRTLELGLAALVIQVAVGIPAGVVAALRRDSLLDRAIIALAVSGTSLPNFFLAILLILLFSVQLGWLPSTGAGTAAHLVMPALVLGTGGAAVLARFTRAAVLEVLPRAFVLASWAAGRPWRLVVRRDALPNAAIPVATVLGFTIGGLVGGAIVTETIFAWPGIGRLLVDSIATRNLPVVQVIVLLIAATMVASNLVIDLLYGWLDPRVAGARARQGGA